ncbi:uncharacterized protein OCT59_011814 [Rhizophagus irregularis]|uniref:BTB domain-containing protein n=3 Tax=Rhizophagus irregularis TaxID=588596 RepID=A0A015K2J3_RHIIW|nr:hypothetical protein RirG_169610 [Rhizophagus irregularis DAOM 197198w]UZO00694.1 hypothetical protein OCT59_011814 [Rhizophagus irregularis]GBC39468.1 sacsin-like isoform X1 [Rhizophagus irregularis DAOM 181602=DAOM 197198]CAG8733670.1 1283_t:CDS:2 [Rhizophagus irregularis]
MSFQSYGQNETLISSIRNIIKDYPFESIFKEFLQNADDAGATRYHVIVDARSHPTDSLFYNEMKAWQGPAILIFNNAKFKETDFESLMQIRVGGKQGDDTKIGKHGLGFNSCYHFTDVPSFISGDSFAFLDPQEKYLSQRGIRGHIPNNGIGGFSKKDQLIPFEGIEGMDFRSTFEGTLFRLPLRKEPSDITDSIFTTKKVRKLLTDIKSIVSSQFLFLRNIETIETSFINETTSPFQITSLWKAVITDLDEDIRNRRKYINNGIIKTFQLKIELTDNSGNKQEEHWIITNGAQQNPEDSKLQEYARKYRLRVLGGIATILKSSENIQDNFKGRMYSFFSLPDAINLPVHLNGTWAQGSDRGKLLIDKDDLPDIDHQKLGWNRYILLDFLPELYCKLLEEIIKLHKNKEIDLKDHPISKYWPFPSVTGNYPKCIVEYGFKVLQLVLKNDDIFQLINEGLPDKNDRVDVLFKFLPREQTLGFRDLLRNNLDELDIKSNPDLKLLIRSLPIWPTLSDPIQPDSKPALKPISCGYILPNKFQHYRTKKDSKIYLYAADDVRKCLIKLDVQERDVYSYTFEDVEFPNEYDYHYVNFLNSILDYGKVVKDLKDKPCFPTYNKKLKKVDQLYDINNSVFKTIFSGNMGMFLHNDLKYLNELSSIGFKYKVNQETFIICAKYIEKLGKKVNPPSDTRYRGFALIDYFYKNIDTLKFEEGMERFQFIPISKDLGKPYNLNHVRTNTLDCFDHIVLSKYKEVAWSQMSLIAEDVVPPKHVLQKYPTLGKPEVTIVIEHLRYLYMNLRVDDEWKTNWAGVFKNNVYEVYKWLEDECKENDIDLTEHIHERERLFLNFNKNQDPFDDDNWVSIKDLILNSQIDEDRYICLALQKYPTMLKSAGVKEVKRPDYKINVCLHNQSIIIGKAVFDLLFDQETSLNDIIFIVDEEEIKANRYMLAASSEFFQKEFSSANPGLIKNTVNDIKPNSMRILLRYLYGQDIDVAIKSLKIDSDTSKFVLYEDLLKLANSYELAHLKEMMELRLSRKITRSNVENMKKFAVTSGANQLKEFCDLYIITNHNL